MTATRIIAPGGTYAITRRWRCRKLFLTPLSEVIHDGMLYILGQAQVKCRVRPHHEVILPNHGHRCVTPTEANLPEFTEYFFGETSKFIKVALAEHGFDPPRKVWDGGQPHYARLMDGGQPTSQMSHTSLHPQCSYERSRSPSPARCGASGEHDGDEERDAYINPARLRYVG
ncbi:MAG: hypothetical protein DRJ42_06485 [Deltaproteobacteria bacterium]|nr:MAG: hypothetical protein DRJ42_06485 [Deltaproteobacteria bacterium]